MHKCKCTLPFHNCWWELAAVPLLTLTRFKVNKPPLTYTAKCNNLLTNPFEYNISYNYKNHTVWPVNYHCVSRPFVPIYPLFLFLIVWVDTAASATTCSSQTVKMFLSQPYQILKEWVVKSDSVKSVITLNRCCVFDIILWTGSTCHL